MLTVQTDGQFGHGYSMINFLLSNISIDPDQDFNRSSIVFKMLSHIG